MCGTSHCNLYVTGKDMIPTSSSVYGMYLSDHLLLGKKNIKFNKNIYVIQIVKTLEQTLSSNI